jgi:hypothetical protein
MKFTELTANPIVIPTDELAELLGIEKGIEIDFFVALEKFSTAKY